MPKPIATPPRTRPPRKSPALRTDVVDSLRSAITGGRFPPGQRLVEREMCELLGVSRTLVREALRQLEAEGWVRLLLHRGPIVATMTPEQIRELYEVRGALEGLAAQLCAGRASEAQLARMVRIVDAMVAAAARGAECAARMVPHRRPVAARTREPRFWQGMSGRARRRRSARSRSPSSG